MTTTFSLTTVPKAGHPLIMDPTTMITPRALNLIPPGVVAPSDQTTVEVFFTRHPWELSMGAEFVAEFNANILALLHRNPSAIVDSLSAIGHSYLTTSADDAALAVLNYRARILATLRGMDLAKYSLEEMVFMLLGLSAIELVDCSGSATAADTTIPAIIANAAALIRHHLSLGRQMTSLARYFTRALARQDMVVSLISLQRPLIPTSVWLDENACTSPDRLMGYTATFMPLLEELWGLAEDMRSTIVFPRESTTEAFVYDDEFKHVDMPMDDYQPNLLLHQDMGTSCVRSICPSWEHQNPAFVQRAESLRTRIEAWKPPLPHGLSFRKSRRFLSQAACYRAGALLYLYRLLHPPSLATDAEATAKAHQVLMATATASNHPDEVKMLLWPVFLAACEMEEEEDRQVVLDILDTIMAQRKTATVTRTRRFVLERVWAARDEGAEWNWMVLAQRYPGECLPI